MERVRLRRRRIASHDVTDLDECSPSNIEPNNTMTILISRIGSCSSSDFLPPRDLVSEVKVAPNKRLLPTEVKAPADNNPLRSVAETLGVRP